MALPILSLQFGTRLIQHLTILWAFGCSTLKNSVEKIVDLWHNLTTKTKGFVMTKLNDYFKDPNIAGKLMPLITPEAGFKSMHVEQKGKTSVLYVNDIPVIHFDGNVITEMYLPGAKKLDSNWIPWEAVKDVKVLNLPNLEKIGHEVHLTGAQKILAPKLKQVGDWCIGSKELQEFDAPQLEIVGQGFLRNSANLRRFNVPNLRKSDGDFLTYNLELEKLYLPKLEGSLDLCLVYNKKLTELYAPKVEDLFECFWLASELEVLDLSNATEIIDSFHTECPKLREVKLPKLIKVDEDVYPSLIIQACQNNLANKNVQKMADLQQGQKIVDAMGKSQKGTAIKPDEHSM